MIIFDIDSLIMLSVSDSQMSKSLSISNIRLYQFIRQKCASAIVKEKENNTNVKKFCWRRFRSDLIFFSIDEYQFCQREMDCYDYQTSFVTQSSYRRYCI